MDALKDATQRYWAAKTPDEERGAYRDMLLAGAEPAYGEASRGEALQQMGLTLGGVPVVFDGAGTPQELRPTMPRYLSVKSVESTAWGADITYVSYLGPAEWSDPTRYQAVTPGTWTDETARADKTRIAELESSLATAQATVAELSRRLSEAPASPSPANLEDRPPQHIAVVVCADPFYASSQFQRWVDTVTGVTRRSRYHASGDGWAATAIRRPDQAHGLTLSKVIVLDGADPATVSACRDRVRPVAEPMTRLSEIADWPAPASTPTKPPPIPRHGPTPRHTRRLKAQP